MPRSKARGRIDRRVRAADRSAQPSTTTVADPRHEVYFTVDFGNLRQVCIDTSQWRLVRPAELVQVERSIQLGQSPILTDTDGRRWMRRRDFEPNCEPRNSDALFLVTWTEECLWIGSACETHRFTTPCTGATHYVSGTDLNRNGEEVGRGVIAWCFGQENADSTLRSLSRCRFRRDLSIGVRAD